MAFIKRDFLEFLDLFTQLLALPRRQDFGNKYSLPYIAIRQNE